MTLLAAESPIYTGPWINWSRGLVLGSTITLSQRDAGLLTAFLGIFVTAAGAACWRLLSYAVHQHRAKEAPRDGLHHQQQVILRNNNTSGAVWQLAQLVWYWRNVRVRAMLRNLPLIALAVCNMTLFAVAGIFSSEVTKAAGNETLLRPSSCGFLTPDDSLPSTSQVLNAAISALNLNDTLAASTYSRACYDNDQKSLQCNQFSQPRIRWKSKSNSSCPFASNLCLKGPMSAYEMDTGLVDSHEMLGINAREVDRMQFRKVSACSPIRTTPYVYEVNDTNPDHAAYGDTLFRYAFGELKGSSNYTFQYNLRDRASISGYVLTPIMARLSSMAEGGWKPIAALNRSDADVTIVFLAPNAVKYESPVLDPFFSAITLSEPMTFSDGSSFSYYEADFAVNVLACTDQYQFCNPINQKCTPLTGINLLMKSTTRLGLSDVQYATMLRIQYAVTFLATYSSIRSRGANALRASETLSDLELVQLGLPPNQWITEISSWFAVSMAKLQQLTINYVTNPDRVPAGLALLQPDTEIKRKQCTQQKIRSPHGYVSFSVLGVSIILIIGSLLIFANLVLDILVGFIMNKMKWKDHKRLQWVVDEKLQLQRLAYEEAGQGHWSGGADAVPLARKDENFGFIGEIDKKHPRFRKDESRNDSGDEITPEARSLIDGKNMSCTVDPVLKEA
ncbi:MAG: hypothetical protein Q9164_001539 [Protoblastenia rupestris]